MLTVPSAFQAALDRGASALQLCFRLSRPDGQVLGFTTWDEALSFGGVTYEPFDGFSCSAFEQSVGTGIDNFEAILTSDRITEEELRAGRYDGASLTVFRVIATNLAAGQVAAAEMRLGSVTISDRQYRIEVRDVIDLLRQTQGKIVQRRCQVETFGDARCRPGEPSWVAAKRFTESVDAVSADYLTLAFNGRPEAEGVFTEGTAKALSGANAGLKREIKRHRSVAGSAECELHEPFPFPVSPGDGFLLTMGCNRSYGDGPNSCTGHGNTQNFDGFPFTPGKDATNEYGHR